MTEEMSDERWNHLMFHTGPVKLTKEELDSGWHWCSCWDDLLIHPSHMEFCYCTCPSGDLWRRNNPNFKKDCSDKSDMSMDIEIGF